MIIYFKTHQLFIVVITYKNFFNLRTFRIGHKIYIGRQTLIIHVKKNTNDNFSSVFQDSFSINLWAKPDDGNPSSGMIFMGVGENDDVYIWLTTVGEIGFYYSTAPYGAGDLTSPAYFSNGVQAWTMLSFTAENISNSSIVMKIYANGILIKFDEFDVKPSSFETGLYTVYIGAYNLEGSLISQFDGDIDNVMIFDKVLNSEEIAILYNSGRGTENFQLSPQLNLIGTALEMVGI